MKVSINFFSFTKVKRSERDAYNDDIALHRGDWDIEEEKKGVGVFYKDELITDTAI